jgi:hypothetical protein
VTSLAPRVPNTVISADIFFDLVDEVLIEVGREPLGGGHRRIITVRPEDRVLQILAGAGSGKTEMLVWRVLYELLVSRVRSSLTDLYLTQHLFR